MIGYSVSLHFKGKWLMLSTVTRKLCYRKNDRALRRQK